MTFDEIEFRLRDIANKPEEARRFPIHAISLRLISPFEEGLTSNQVAAVNQARLQFCGVAMLERDLKEMYAKIAGDFGKLRGREDALNRLAASCIPPWRPWYLDTNLIDLLIEVCETLQVTPETLDSAISASYGDAGLSNR